MPLIVKGEVSGEVVRDEIVVVRTYDYLCLKHPKPKLMKQTVNRETQEDGKIKIVLGKMCHKCYQYVKEGEYLDDQEQSSQ